MSRNLSTIVFLLLLMALPSAACFLVIGDQSAADNAFWYVSRAAAMTAYLLLTLSVCLGLLVRTRLLEWLASRWRWFDLHQFTSLLALGFLLLHILSLLGDRYIGFSLDELLVPFASPYRPLEVAAGVLGLYLMLGLVLTSYFQRFIGYRTWRAVHYLSFTLFVLALLHGLFTGSDSSQPWAAGFYWATGLVVAALTAWRFRSASRRNNIQDRGLPTSSQALSLR